MASSPSEERVDLSKLASKMGVQITNTDDLVDAMRASKSCLPLNRGGHGEEA